jgi:hypothetical protein
MRISAFNRSCERKQSRIYPSISLKKVAISFDHDPILFSTANPADEVFGRHNGGEWPREQFRKQGVNYEPAESSKSEIYVDLLPLINSGAVDLLDHERLVTQLTSLERRTSRGGRDSIDHAPGGHDDIANAVASALVTVYKNPGVPNFNRPIVLPNTGIF